jgi:hypothetical protein
VFVFYKEIYIRLYTSTIKRAPKSWASICGKTSFIGICPKIACDIVTFGLIYPLLKGCMMSKRRANERPIIKGFWVVNIINTNMAEPKNSVRY